MKENELIPHLFRTEYRKITAVLVKRFGIEHMQAAEDIASDTFLQAAESWGLKGLPENPPAWLYTVAKNKAKNHFRHSSIFKQKIAPQLKLNEAEEEIDIDLSPENIRDSQLQMMFAICHPAIVPEAQVGLALRILCGFGLEEIAAAFLEKKETIKKRLTRAREKLRSEKISISFPATAELNTRLDNVLTTLYLLFNEGYYSAGQDKVLRKDLCWEAMRLVFLLIENPSTNLPPVNALFSLMSFHASRFDARTDAEGKQVLYDDQNTSLWDEELVKQGAYFLNSASEGTVISKYHLEANIAYWHTIREDTAERWENILQLYNHLLIIEYSPMAALNRTYAVSKVHGKQAAIAEAEKLDLREHHLYYALLGNLYTGIDLNKAIWHTEQALRLAKSAGDKKVLEKQLEECKRLSTGI